jgi:Co/Zn/Cd efflux system component
MELTKEEKRLAERSLKKHKGFLCRKSGILGWIGVVLFAVGILPIFSLAEWIDDLLVSAGFVLLILSLISLCMRVIGKLYARIQELENMNK